NSPGFGADSGNCSAPASNPSPHHVCATIAYAIGQAQFGDAVHVGGGTYAEAVTLPGNVSLVEDPRFAPPATSGNAVVDGGAAPAITVAGGAGGSVSGLTIRGGDGGGASMATQALAQVTITHNRFDDPSDTVATYLALFTDGAVRVIDNKFVGDDD